VASKRVLVTDYPWESNAVEASVLSEVGAELVVAETGSEAELLSLIADVDAVLVCFAKIPGSVIRAGKNLQVVGRVGRGLDNIDVVEATQLGIPVTHVPAYCLDEVSDHAMALLLACARKVCAYHMAVRQGDWSLQTGAPMHRLRGRTLGVLGLGKIGQTLVAKAKAFGLRAIASDPYVSPSIASGLGVELVEPDALFSQADYLSLHVPLNAETRGMVNEVRLRQMKATAILINTARGPVVDQDALVRALQAGWIAGAGLDVFEEERLPLDHPLLHLPNVVTTPHAAFYSEEALLDLRTKGAKNVAKILSGRRPAAVANPQVLELPRWAHLRA
jgi:D-3-phosphoglycerate dehydrogenase